MSYSPEITPNGTRCWSKNDHLHREDGPAVEYKDGSYSWFLNGLLHRTDGPAMFVLPGGICHWFLNGSEIIPDKAIHDSEFISKHPKLVESMLIYLVHRS